MADTETSEETPPSAPPTPRRLDHSEDIVIILDEEVTEFGRKRLLEREAKRMGSDIGG